MPRSPELERFEALNPQPESLPDSDPELFVSDEEAFCKEHHANIERLENGATVFTMAHRVEDGMNAEIELTFPCGSRFDPPGKQGITHLAEHISLSGMVAEALRIQNDFNGTTTQVDHDITLGGIANPDFRSVGIWPILDMIGPHTADHRHIDEFTVERIALELETIKEEITLEALSHDHAATKNLVRILYASDHPYQSNVLGTPKDLERITLPDLEKQFYRMHHPKGTVISALTHEGKTSIAPSLHTELSRIARNLPTTEAPCGLPTHAEVGSVKLIETGSLFTADTGIKNKLVTAQLLWQLPVAPRSTEFFAIERFHNLLNGYLFDFIRTRGLAYDFKTNVFGDNEPIATVVVKFDVSRQKHIERNVLHLADEFQESLMSEISDDVLEQSVEQENIYHAAVPPSTQTHYELAVYGLQRHGRLMNFDEIMRRDRAVTVEHLVQVLHRIVSQKATVLLTGDIS